jgi:hypothetical protein
MMVPAGNMVSNTFLEVSARISPVTGAAEAG